MQVSPGKLLGSILLLIFLGCTKEKEIRRELKNIYVSRGIACWYGKEFEGKKTSSGQIFRRNNLTAAHKFLEFETLIKVTFLANNKSVVVEINDRGPYSGGKVLDLSEKAAKEIGLYEKGSGEVQIEIFGYKHINFCTFVKHQRNLALIRFCNKSGKKMN